MSHPIEIPLVVTGVNLDDHATLDTLAQQLDDLLWTESAAGVTATVFADADPTAAALHAARRIYVVFPHALVQRVDPDLVTVSAIASRVGVSRQAVQQWVSANRIPLFPAPFDVLEPEEKPVKVWRWAEVTPWLREVKGLEFEHLLAADQVPKVDAALIDLRRGDSEWRETTLAPHAWRSRVNHKPVVHFVRSA